MSINASDGRIPAGLIQRLYEQEKPKARWTKLGFSAARSTLGRGMSIVKRVTQKGLFQHYRHFSGMLARPPHECPLLGKSGMVCV
jgi:hypothetical protein